MGSVYRYDLLRALLSDPCQCRKLIAHLLDDSESLSAVILVLSALCLKMVAETVSGIVLRLHLDSSTSHAVAQTALEAAGLVARNRDS